MKKVLATLAMILLPVTGAFAQTAGQSVMGFLLAQGSTYNGYTCPSSATSPCFVQYGASVPTGTTPTGTQDTNLKQVNGNTVNTGVGSSSTGTQRIIQSSGTYTSSAALASNTVVCSSACSLTSFEVSADSTLSGAAWWVLVFDATSLPANGAITPSKCYAMPSGTTNFSAGFTYPVSMTTGAVVGVSTTGCFTLTASVHAFLSGDKL